MRGLDIRHTHKVYILIWHAYEAYIEGIRIRLTCKVYVQDAMSALGARVRYKAYIQGMHTRPTHKA